MSTEPESVAVEQDPDSLAEEHQAELDVAASPEEYLPEPELEAPTREADPADVAEQLAEVPVEEEADGATDAPES